MAGYKNTVPQGIAGTGNATIYGENPVAAQFGNQLAALRQRQYQDDLIAQKQAEEQAQIWRQNQLKIQGGMLWAPEISKMEQAHIQNGIALKQKGINPYGSSPEALAYQQRQLEIEAKQNFRKSVEDQAKEREKWIQQNIDKLDPKEIKKYHDYLASAKLDDAFKGNFALPEIRTLFKVNDVIKDINPVTREDIYTDPKTFVKTTKKYLDFDKTADALIGRLALDDRGAEKLKEITSGMPVNELRTFSTDLAANKERVKQEILGNPDQLKKLAREGIVPGTGWMDGLVDQIAKEQTAAKRKFDNEMKGLVMSVSGGLAQKDETEKLRDPNEMTPYQKAMLGQGQQRINIAQQNANKEPAGAGAAGSTDTRRQWIQDIRDVKDDALEKLVAAGNANELYNKNDKFYIRKVTSKDAAIEPGKGTVVLHVPAKTKVNPSYDPDVDAPEKATITVTPPRDVKINLADPNFETFMNQLIGDVTGARVDLGSVGAKSANLKKSPASSKPSATQSAPLAPPAKKTIKASDISAKAKAAGYTDKEYEALLRQNGVQIIK